MQGLALEFVRDNQTDVTIEIENLREFITLNMTAVAKIVKKFKKHCGIDLRYESTAA